MKTYIKVAVFFRRKEKVEIINRTRDGCHVAGILGKISTTHEQTVLPKYQPISRPNNIQLLAKRGLFLFTSIVISTASAVPALGTSAAYSLNGGTASLTNQILNATANDESGVYVYNKGDLTLINPTISSSGNTSSSDNSSFYGLNAVVLAVTNSTARIINGTVTSTGTGANGAFAVGSSSLVTLSNVVITCTGQYAHGLDATWGGTLRVTNVTASTTGANGSVLATDRGGGYIYVYGGSYTSGGRDSAGVYSTGVIDANDATITSVGGEPLIIEGGNSAALTNCVLTGAKGSKDRGIFLYQSMSGDASSGGCTLYMVNGSYKWPSTSGPAFYITNQKGVIYLRNVDITNESPTLLLSDTNSWGTSGANGGVITLIADSQTLDGAILSGKISTNTIILTNNSTLTGYINTAYLSLDAGSVWNVTSNSVLKALTNAGTITGTATVTNGNTIVLQGGSIGVNLAGSYGVTKTTTNTAILSGANTYVGSTLVNSGILNVNGSLSSTNVTVASGAILGGTGTLASNLTLQAGASLVLTTNGCLTIGGTLTFGGSTTVVADGDFTPGIYTVIAYKNISGTPAFTFSSSDSTLMAVFDTTTSGVVTMTVTSTGTLVAPADLTVVAGDSVATLSWSAVTGASSYAIKRSTSPTGTFLTIASGLTELEYTDSGLVNGTVYYYTVSAASGSVESAESTYAMARPVSKTVPQISFKLSESGLTISWAADHVGWRLQTQTNSLSTGIGTNWVDVVGSVTNSEMTLPIDTANKAVFFRLVY